MSHRDGRVTLSAWVDPVLREHARLAAKASGVEFSRWVERAIQQAVAKASVERSLRDARASASAHGECLSCGYSPCMCDQA
jgi:post-segregation antitoxin (ccd killing protein)